MNAEMRAKLEQIATDPNESDAIRKAATARLKKADRDKASLAQRQRKARVSQRNTVQRYRVNGVWKLTERIADFDAEGDVVNGYSDKI